MAEVGRGRLVALDGPSGAGKSTIATRLLGHPSLGLQLVRRYTTREPRPGDAAEGNYTFITTEAFEQMEIHKKFVEVQHYKFGMSYGLPVKETDAVLKSGKNALTIINLGNIGMIRRHYPNAIGIFVTAPIDAIERRLRSRGLNEEYIQERLDNAVRSASYVHLYDYVVSNEDGRLDQATDLVVVAISRATGSS